MLKHTSDLFDRVLGPAREGNMTQSFDAIHNAALEPPETRPCEPGGHEPDWRTVQPDPRSNGVIFIRCHYCDLGVSFDRGDQKWEEWSEL